MASYAAPLRFPAVGRHTATVIFSHGLGDTGYGWAPVAETLGRRSQLSEVKFILPHAPSIPITCNGGMRMPGWYDIKSIDGTAESLRKDEDEAGIRASAKYLQDLIDQEISAGVPPERIVIGGFSQGGAMSLFAGLTAKVKLAAVVALSAYLPLSLKFEEATGPAPANKTTPIFMGHGTQDVVVPIDLATMSKGMLERLGYDITWKTYTMGHSAVDKEIDDLANFLAQKLPQLGDKPAEKAEL